MLLVLLVVAASAQEAPEERQAGEDDAVIVVQDVPTVQEAREALDDALSARGYVGKAQRDGDVVYRHPDVWRPAVVVTPDGRMKVRRRGVALTPPGGTWDPDATALDYAKCLTPWTLFSCVSARGLVMDRLKYRAHQTATVAALHDEHAALTDALSAEAVDGRIDRELAAIWEDGIAPDGTPLPDAAARRAAIGELWASRTPGPWGDRARTRIEAFVEIVVQRSPTPFTPEEIAAVEARAGVDRRFAHEAVPVGPPDGGDGPGG